MPFPINRASRVVRRCSSGFDREVIAEILRRLGELAAHDQHLCRG